MTNTGTDSQVKKPHIQHVLLVIILVIILRKCRYLFLTTASATYFRLLYRAKAHCGCTVCTLSTQCTTLHAAHSTQQRNSAGRSQTRVCVRFYFFPVDINSARCDLCNKRVSLFFRGLKKKVKGLLCFSWHFKLYLLFTIIFLKFLYF